MRKLIFAATILILLPHSAHAALKSGTKVFRGGDCAAESFRKGSNEGNNFYGELSGISVYAANGFTTAAALQALNADFVQTHGCWTKVQDITAAGGAILFRPVFPGGPDHYEIDGLTAEQLVAIFKDKRW